MGEFFAGMFILIYCFVLGVMQAIWYMMYLVIRFKGYSKSILDLEIGIKLYSWHEFRLLTSDEYCNEIDFCEKSKRLDLIEYCYEKHPFQYIWKRFNKIMHNLEDRNNY